MTDLDSYFHRMLRGELPPPPVATLLGWRIETLDVAAGTLSAHYVGEPSFRNPGGQIAGGMLCAMLDDLTACLVDAVLVAGQAPVTLSITVSFLRPAQVGPLSGQASLIRRGRDLCHVTGMLQQDGKDIAHAVAICKVVTR